MTSTLLGTTFFLGGFLFCAHAVTALPRPHPHIGAPIML